MRLWFKTVCALSLLIFSTEYMAANNGLASEIVYERVFDAQHPGPYKHPAAITELENGDLYIAYYGGMGEYERDTAVYGSRLKVGENVWTHPVAIASTPFHSVGNPVVWQAPDGLVWLFYVNRYGDTWSTSRIKAKISRDGAETWSDSFVLSFEEGAMVRGKPILLNNGDYLLPVYHETGHDTEMTGPDSTSFFLRFDAETQTWSETDRICSPMGNIQAEVAQITDEYLVCYIRRGGDYHPTDSGYLLRAESRDGGNAWSEAKETEFPNPNAAVEFLRLQSGNLLLIYNDNMNARTPLTAAISTDNDASYPYRRNIAEGNDAFAYPYAIQTRDGKIHLIYTCEHRTVIMRAIFDEEAIISGSE